jgi:Thioredoxin-like [2Fe-2S] ferredoxin
MKTQSPDGQRPTVGHRSTTQLVGQFVSYEIKDGYKVKRLNLLTVDGMQSVKLSKESRAAIFRLTTATPIIPGTLLSLAVEAKFDDGAMQYKVRDLQILAAGTAIPVAPIDAPTAKVTSRVTKIRVCDRGTCRKRGAREIYAQLQQEIADRGLTDRVVVETTSCLDQCKQGPNITIGKICHSRICPSRASQLLPLA